MIELTLTETLAYAVGLACMIDTTLQPVFNASYRRVGGIRFLRIGQLQVSFCRTRKPIS